MEWVIYLLGAVILAVVLVVLSWFRKEEQDDERRVQRARPRVGDVAQVVQGPNRAAANRGARARMRIAQARREEAEREEEDEAEVGDEVALPDGKVGKKKLQKLQAKAEKRAAREAEERERVERKERADKIAEQRKKEEEKVAEEEAKHEEEERKLQEEKERQEEEEYQRLKASFVVQEEGFDEEENEEKERDLLKEFIDCIKHEKVVVLEDIAARFKLKTTAVIDRISSLQQEGTLSGVIDDRGKFIYISKAELEAVAKFMKQRGRVSLAELADSSNTLIALVPESRSA